jgi:eukaryotic-like serine/threonine-protein kinase
MGPTSTSNAVRVRREGKRCATCGQGFSRDAGFCPFDGTRLEAASFDLALDPLIGTRIDGRYDVVSVLGEGGMGRIYEVRHAALARPFAMKVLRPELAQDADLAARFILEAKATASVKHPNVVQITDFGHMPDGVPFFVMELLVGTTLGAVIHEGGPVAPARAVRIIRKVAGALAAAHAAGVVHRDLKPDNVFLIGGSREQRGLDDPDRPRALAMLGYAADVRVVDFGAAKIVGTSRMTKAGVVFGTPHYMSPEQASGQTVDHRADVYALGVIMYEMFTAQVPFEADTYMGVLTQHMFVEPVPPSQVANAAQQLGSLESITLTCLAKKPEDRFASMDDLIAAIDDVVRLSGDEGVDLRSSSNPPSFAGGSSRSRPSSALRSSAAEGAEFPSLAELRAAIDDPDRTDAPARGVPWPLVVAIGIAVLGTLAGAWLLLRDTPAPVVPATAALGTARLPEAKTTAAPVLTAPVSAALAVPAGAPEAGVGESEIPSAKAVTQPGRRSPAKAPRATGGMDDVGDPFAPGR